MSIIQPRTLAGFRDFLPREMLQRQALMDTARGVYQSFGFSPIDTPTLELLEILTGKGSEETDRQMYRFQDHGGRDVGMRFDLTVPLARYVAQHINELGTPFKRYHIAPVWRGERAQRGRYREFVQCDFDTIGTHSIMADIEMVLVIHDLFRQLGFERFQIRINNRKLLNGMLASLGLQDVSTAVLRALDKLEKVGADAVAQEMVQQAGIQEPIARRILELSQQQGDWQAVLKVAEGLVGDQELGRQGMEELRQVMEAAAAAGIPDQRVVLDVSIARGLDYYTGTIVETILDDLPEIGSVCSGGRYDNLAGLYTKQDLPGVGASLGLDRLLAAMEELGLGATAQTPSQILIAYFDPALPMHYLELASQMRQAGLNVEVYPEPAKLKKQLKYADQKQIPAVLVIGSQEFQDRQVQLKWMQDSQQENVSIDGGIDSLIMAIRSRLTDSPAARPQ